MDRPSFSIAFLRRKSVVFTSLVLLVLVAAIAGVAPSQENVAPAEQQTIRQLVQNYIQVGTEQYQNGEYDSARRTFLMAQGYQEYLDSGQREQLREMLDKASVAAAKDEKTRQQREPVQQAYRRTLLLIQRGRWELARAEIEKVRNDKTLTLEETQQIGQVVRLLDAKIRESKAKAATAQGSQATAAKLGQATAAKTGSTVSTTASRDTSQANRRNQVSDLYYRSVGLYALGELEKARAGFVQVLESGQATPAMVATIRGHIAKIDERLGSSVAAGASGAKSQADAQQAQSLFEESVSLYHQGKLEEAREGFAKVAASGSYQAALGRRPEDYLDMIEALLTQKVEQGASLESQPDRQMMSVAEPGEPAIGTGVPSDVGAGQGGYIEVINRKRNILRSHTSAVVADSLEKAKMYMGRGEFDKAKEVVDTAEMIVNENQLHLGDELFKQHSTALTQMKDEIGVKKVEHERTLEEQRRAEATESQKNFREQMEVDRQNRVAELMENAKAYQKQQRYEAALGQIERLLAIDPQNGGALTMKDTLEDTIYFRKQLEVQKEANKQRADILTKTDESGIPYAEEITYPKNWREIVQKPTRKPDEPIGLEPVDMEVYKQLDEIVNLSELKPETALSDAIEIIRKIVQPPLRIVVLWRDLYDNAQVEPTTRIDMDGLPAVRLGAALDSLLKAVSGGFAQIGYVVDNGVITIATVASLPSKLETRVYDVTDLVGEPSSQTSMMNMMSTMSMMSMYSGGGGGGGMYGGGGGMYGGGGSMYGGGGGMYGGGGGMYGGGGGMYGGGGGGMYGGGGGMYGGGGSMYGGGGGMYGGGGGMYGGGGGMYGGGGGGMYGGGGGMYGGGGGMYGGGGGMYGGGMYGGGGGGYYQAQSLLNLIMETIEPESWYELSDTGEGTIMLYPQQQPKKLAILQTREVHKKIETLLLELRKALGYQVSIETRFLVVSENFLEEIGLDVDFTYNFGGKWGQVTFDQGSEYTAQAEPTQVAGSLAGSRRAMEVIGGYGSILDNLQVAFILRAAQAHRDARSLTAPRATVLSGELASFNIQRSIPLALPPVQQSGIVTGGTTPAGQGGITTAGGGLYPREIQIPSGSVLLVTPIITHDKKNVLLSIVTTQMEFLGVKRQEVEAPILGQTGEVNVYKWPVDLPETETSQLTTRVSVPDGGTLLLGGQKVTSEVEREAGVPVLSKIPVVGRLFSNRSKVRDQKILLILVKPTIILQEEKEAEALAALEGGS